MWWLPASPPYIPHPPFASAGSLKDCPNNSPLRRTDHLRLPRSVVAEVHNGSVGLNVVFRWLDAEGCQRQVKGPRVASRAASQSPVGQPRRRTMTTSTPNPVGLLTDKVALV